MPELIQLVVALFVFVLGIVLIVAQLQLFAIKRLLEILVKQTRTRAAPDSVQMSAPTIAEPPPPTPAEQKKNRVLNIVFVALFVLFVLFVIFILKSGVSAK